MADNSLDDFFAKKDKKGKKKSTEKTKKPKKKKETDGSSNPELNSTGQKTQDDAEWLDFEQEEEKDYSGLRITNLTITNREEEDDRDTERKSDDEEGEDGERKEAAPSGPWNKVPSQPDPTPPPAPVKEVVKEEAPARTGKYIPPGARAAAKMTTASSAATRKKNKQAPDIQDDHAFPTLGGPIDRDTREFQKVVNRGKPTEAPAASQAPQLQLDNKYNVLSNNDN